MYIDSHAHLSSEELFPKWKELQQRAHMAGIEAIVNICTDELSLQQGRKLQGGSLPVYLTAATTPHDVEKEGDSFFPLVEQAAHHQELIAIGETGLDYYYEHSPKELQKEHLLRYFHLSVQTNLPIIFHCRNAFADLFSLSDLSYAKKPALIHCFTGTIEEAKQALDRGWYLSFSGILTFKKSENLRQVAKYAPLDRILIETDAPFLAPQTKRGKENEPSFLPETAYTLSLVKDLPLDTLAEQLKANTRAFFSF